MIRKVCVLMSSYNGEKYIREQIESILNQEKVEVYLIIRDDGSTDKTLEILSEYEKLDCIKVIRGENYGVKKSFLTLISIAPGFYDYYALSDQDDFWLSDKLISAIELIEKNGIELDDNFLYFSNKTMVDKKLRPINSNGYNVNTPYNFGEVLIKNCASGCTFVYGRYLKNVIKQGNDIDVEEIPMYDHWIYMICLALDGKIVFDENSHIKYRCHDRNVVGNKRTLKTKILKSSLLCKSDTRYRYAKYLMKKYDTLIPDYNKSVLNKIIDYKKSLRKTLILALDKYIKPRSVSCRCMIFLSVLRRSF